METLTYLVLLFSRKELLKIRLCLVLIAELHRHIIFNCIFIFLNWRLLLSSHGSFCPREVYLLVDSVVVEAGEESVEHLERLREYGAN
jgi:hypothetical protein